MKCLLECIQLRIPRIIRCTLITCSRHWNSKIFEFKFSKSLFWFFLMILWQTIWGVLEKNISLLFRKGWVILEQSVLLLIKQKNHNKRFGGFEFQYFGGSDDANKLLEKFLKRTKQIISNTISHVVHYGLWNPKIKEIYIFGAAVKYASAVTKNLGLGCNSVHASV